MGNGAKVSALAVGNYYISLPSGLILELFNYYYVPALTTNIISISCLDLNGFKITQENKCCSFSKNGVFYGSGNWNNGLYILDLDNQILNIQEKRMKLDKLNKTYLWHCRLGHINEKRISKLHKGGYLDSFDYESYDVYETWQNDQNTLYW